MTFSDHSRKNDFDLDQVGECEKQQNPRKQTAEAEKNVMLTTKEKVYQEQKFKS